MIYGSARGVSYVSSLVGKQYPYHPHAILIVTNERELPSLDRLPSHNCVPGTVTLLSYLADRDLDRLIGMMF